MKLSDKTEKLLKEKKINDADALLTEALIKLAQEIEKLRLSWRR